IGCVGGGSIQQTADCFPTERTAFGSGLALPFPVRESGCVEPRTIFGQRGAPMYIIVDERSVVTGGYASSFDREGISSAGIDPTEFRDWIGKVSESDVNAIEAFLIGDWDRRKPYPRPTRGRPRPRVIALMARQSLDQPLELFAAGVHAVLRKPVHV